MRQMQSDRDIWIDRQAERQRIRNGNRCREIETDVERQIGRQF